LVIQYVNIKRRYLQFHDHLHKEKFMTPLERQFALKRKGITQTKIAEEIGVTPSNQPPSERQPGEGNQKGGHHDQEKN
jgi:hypothetical protein